MSLNLGTLLVGLNVNTAPMRRAVREVEQFTKTVDRMVKTSDDPRIANAFQKQERAVVSALTKVAQMQQQLRDLGAQPQQIAKLTRAFQRYSATMRSGALDTLKFNRTQDKLKIALATSSQSLRELRNQSHGAGKSQQNLLKHVRDLESASVLAVGPLSGLGARIRALASITSRGSLGVAAFFGALTAGIVILGNLARNAIMARQEFEKITVAFEAALGSTQAANAEFQFVVETTREMGIGLRESARNYARLNAAAANTKTTQGELRQLFRGTAAAASVFNLQAQELEGVMRALEQMMSKGVVSSDELRRQFALRIPGAMKIAADSMGVTEQEFNRMLARGEIMAVDLLPKLGKQLEQVFGEQAKTAANNMESSIQNLQRETFLFSLELDNLTGLSRAWQSAINSATKIVRFLAENLKFIVPIVTAVGVAFGLLFAKWVIGLRVVVAFFRPLKTLAGALKTASAGASSFANFMSRLNAIIGSGGMFKLATAIVTIGTAFMGTSKALEDTQEAANASIEALKEFDNLGAEGNYTDLRKLNAELQLAHSNLVLTTARVAQQQQRVRELAVEYANMRDASQERGTRTLSFRGLKETAQLFMQRRALDNANDALNAMQENQRKLQRAIDGTAERAKAMNLELESFVVLSDEAQKVVGQLADQTREWQQLSRTAALIEIGTDAEGLQYIQDMNAALAILKDVPQSEWGEISATFSEIGDESENLVTKLIRLIQQRREFSNFIQETVTNFDKGQSTLANVREEIDSLNELLQASARGPNAFQDFLDMRKLNDQMSEWREILTKAQIDQQVINSLLGEYVQLRTRANEAEERQKAFQKSREEGQKVFQDMNEELREFDAILRASLGSQEEFGQWLESRDLNKRLDEARSSLVAYGLSTDAVNAFLDEFRVKAEAAARAAAFGQNATQRAEEYRQAIDGAQRDMAELNLRTDAMSGSLKQWRRNQELLERNDFLNDFMAKLLAANVPFREAVALTWEMSEALARNNEAVKQMEMLEGIYNELKRGIEKAFDDIGEAITQAFVRGEESAISFRSVVSGVITGIMQQITRMAIINPIMNAIMGSFSFGANTPTAGNAVPGGTYSHGAAFTKGLKKFAKGGVVNSPTYFGTSSGPGLMGEAGPEAVMPLKRLSSGKLGVESSGSGTTIIIEGDNIDARNMAPETLAQLLPILKQRDENLKNQILQMQQRGR